MTTGADPSRLCTQCRYSAPLVVHKTQLYSDGVDSIMNLGEHDDIDGWMSEDVSTVGNPGKTLVDTVDPTARKAAVYTKECD